MAYSQNNSVPLLLASSHNIDNYMFIFTFHLLLISVITGMLTKFLFSFYLCYFFRRPSLQTSREIFLSKCRFYFIETLMKQSDDNDCVSVGMKFPNGTYQRPIESSHLFWVRPGKLTTDPLATSDNYWQYHKLSTVAWGR